MVAASVHAQVLDPSFDRLPPPLRVVHDTRARKEFSGRCSIESGRSWLARVIQIFASLPPRSHADVAVHVVIERNERSKPAEIAETWTRRFGEHRMQSIIRAGRGALEECFLFVPLPTAWFAGCGAFETIIDGRYWFDACAHIAGVGLLVHYKGWLVEHGG